jgi:hypothetical protein
VTGDGKIIAKDDPLPDMLGRKNAVGASENNAALKVGKLEYFRLAARVLNVELGKIVLGKEGREGRKIGVRPEVASPAPVSLTPAGRPPFSRPVLDTHLEVPVQEEAKHTRHGIRRWLCGMGASRERQQSARTTLAVSFCACQASHREDTCSVFPTCIVDGGQAQV